MRRSASSIIWGGIIILLGVGFLLDNLGILNFGRTIGDFWPLILIVIGAGQLFEGKRTSAMVWAILGVVFELSALGIIHGNIVGIIFSLLVVWIGLTFFTRSLGRSEVKVEESENDSITSATAFFGGVKKKIDASDFRAATINSIFGGSKIDLSSASFDEKGAVIDTFVIFGGSEITVPKGTRIKTDVFALFGGVDDKRVRDSEKKTGKTLKIQGFVFFGGLEIKE